MIGHFRLPGGRRRIPIGLAPSGVFAVTCSAGLDCSEISGLVIGAPARLRLDAAVAARNARLVIGTRIRMPMLLKLQLERHLPGAWHVLAGDSAERGAGWRRVRRQQIGMVP